MRVSQGNSMFYMGSASNNCPNSHTMTLVWGTFLASWGVLVLQSDAPQRGHLSHLMILGMERQCFTQYLIWDLVFAQIWIVFDDANVARYEHEQTHCRRCTIIFGARRWLVSRNSCRSNERTGSDQFTWQGILFHSSALLWFPILLCILAWHNLSLLRCV